MAPKLEPAADWATDLPTLTGSTKQVNWAYEIRREMAGRTLPAAVEAYRDTPIDIIKSALRATFALYTSGHWWIQWAVNYKKQQDAAVRDFVAMIARPLSENVARLRKTPGTIERYIKVYGALDKMAREAYPAETPDLAINRLLVSLKKAVDTAVARRTNAVEQPITIDCG